MGSKKPDRAMELPRAHVLSRFQVVIPTSDLSHAEIISRRGRAVLETSSLTVQEHDIKNGLMQGAILMSQWSSAHLALFSAAELREIGDKKYRDSPNRFKDFLAITSYNSNPSYDGNQLTLSGFRLGPASLDITI